MRLSLIVLILVGFGAHAQKQIGTLAIRYFEYGNEAKNKGRYREADSLYTESLKWGSHANTYFNRAGARRELGNDEGYCSDMAEAASMGDFEAWQLHCMSCGTWTVLYKDSSGMPLLDSTGYATRLYIQGSPYFQQYFFTTVDADGDTLDDFVVYRNGDTVRHQSKNFQPARFAGGWEKFDAYMKAKLYYPEEARGHNVQGRVIVAYTVAEDGTISNIRIVRGVDGLNEEVLRFMRVLPRFQPALLNGHPVKSNNRLPIDFSLYEDTHVYWQRFER